MPFRRHSDADSKSARSASSRRLAARHAVSRSVRPVCEKLEERQLLTALVNGLFTDNGTTQFDYAQPDNTHIRISVFGNITAEFIGGNYDPTTPSNVTLSDLQPFTDGGPPSTTWLFSIYVVKADMNSTISISGVTGTPPHMDPRTGTETLRFTNSWTGVTDTVSLDGAVYIGAKTPSDFQDPADNIPLIYADQRKFGMRPSSAGELFAGLEVAPGNDLGRFFVGGAITGLVDVPGNMETFYANNVLTGDAQGIPFDGTDNQNLGSFFTGFPPQGNVGHFPNKNFHIGGDIRNLLSDNSFGTVTLADATPLYQTTYKTGFQLDVIGRVGQIKALDSFMGQAVIHDDPNAQGPGILQREIEYRGVPLTGAASYFDPFFFGNDISPNAQTTATSSYNNDTFDTAQWLGTAFSRSMHSNEVIQLQGSLNNNGLFDDNIDFYAVPLLAGQVMQVQILGSSAQNTGGATSGLAIEDPDGRIIATNYSSVIANFRQNAPIRIVADRPGSYRIVVARFGDTNFNGVADDPQGSSALSPDQYELRIRKVADLALGGLIVENHIATTDLQSKSIEVLNGDIGEIRAGLVGAGTIWSWAQPYYIPNGNLRAMEAFDYGIYSAGTFTLGGTDGTHFPGPDFMIRKGSLGLLRETGTGTDLVVNDDQFIYPTGDDDLNRVDRSVAVGNEIQVVDAAGTLGGDLLSNGPIGVIRAGSVGAGLQQPVWMADVNQSGSDGKIDLIDVTGDVNGPAIWTGPNGDVRYMNVGGTAFRDPRFGGGVPEVLDGAPGQKLSIVDDSGTTVLLTPTPLQANPTAGVGQAQFLDPPSLSVVTYPIRSGGKVIVSVTVTPSDQSTTAAVVGGGGLTVDTSARGNIGSVGIAQINITGTSPTGAFTGTGIPIIFDSSTRTYTEEAPPPNPSTAAPAPRPIDLLFRGPSTVDVWNITAPPALTFRNIENDTDGEIVNITGSPDVENLEANNIGIARASTGAAVLGVPFAAPLRSNVFPFVGQRNLIEVGDLANVSAREQLGNILAANIGTITANSDGHNVRGVFEGINGPIHAVGDGSDTTGNIISVRIGEGVLPSGSGDVVYSGLYADGLIDSVTGKNADIRGTIAATGLTTRIQTIDATTNVVTSTPDWTLGEIRLNNGSIINAHIFQGTDFTTTREAFSSLPFAATDFPGFNGQGAVNPIGTENPNKPVYDIGSIRLDGTGGIIGSTIQGADIGPIEINGGFGVILTDISNTTENTIAGITTDGYGLRGDLITGGGTVVELDARGNGKRVPTTWYNPNVRLSEKYMFDPYSSNELDALNDLHQALGTTAKHPRIKGISDTGSIEDSVIHAKNELLRLDANRIIARNITGIDPRTGLLRVIPYGDSAYPMQLNFDNRIDSINVRDQIDGLSLVTGELDSLSTRNDVQHAFLDVRGRAKSLTAGAFRGTTTIRVVGGEGQIDYIATNHSLYATVITSRDIINAKVGTDIGSPFFSSSATIHHITINGSILSGAHVRAARRIVFLTVGHDIKEGAVVSTRRLDNQTVKGQVLGDVIISPTP